MTALALIRIAEEWNCSLSFSFCSPDTRRVKVSLYRGDRRVIDFAVHDDQMPWPGYDLAKALQARLKEEAK